MVYIHHHFIILLLIIIIIWFAIQIQNCEPCQLNKLLSHPLLQGASHLTSPRPHAQKHKYSWLQFTAVLTLDNNEMSLTSICRTQDTMGDFIDIPWRIYVIPRTFTPQACFSHVYSVKYTPRFIVLLIVCTLWCTSFTPYHVLPMMIYFNNNLQQTFGLTSNLIRLSK